jgi:hypothetical protein
MSGPHVATPPVAAGAPPCSTTSCPLPPRKNREVRNPREAMALWDDMVDEISSAPTSHHSPANVHDSDDSDDGVGKLADALDGDTISIAFSGVGAPECAAKGLAHAVNKRLTNRGRREIIPPPVLFQAECRADLLLAGNQDDSCVCGDINAFRVDALHVMVAGLLLAPELAFETLAGPLASGNSVREFAYCHRHSKRCRTGCCEHIKLCHVVVRLRCLPTCDYIPRPARLLLFDIPWYSECTQAHRWCQLRGLVNAGVPESCSRRHHCLFHGVGCITTNASGDRGHTRER